MMGALQILVGSQKEGVELVVQGALISKPRRWNSHQRQKMHDPFHQSPMQLYMDPTSGEGLANRICCGKHIPGKFTSLYLGEDQ